MAALSLAQFISLSASSPEFFITQPVPKGKKPYRGDDVRRGVDEKTTLLLRNIYNFFTNYTVALVIRRSERCLQYIVN